MLLHADQLLELSGNDAVAMRSRGLALVMLQRYQEAWDGPGTLGLWDPGTLGWPRAGDHHQNWGES